MYGCPQCGLIQQCLHYSQGISTNIISKCSYTIETKRELCAVSSYLYGMRLLSSNFQILLVVYFVAGLLAERLYSRNSSAHI